MELSDFAKTGKCRGLWLTAEPNPALARAPDTRSWIATQYHTRQEQICRQRSRRAGRFWSVQKPFYRLQKACNRTHRHAATQSTSMHFRRAREAPSHFGQIQSRRREQSAQSRRGSREAPSPRKRLETYIGYLHAQGGPVGLPLQPRSLRHRQPL